MGVRFNRDGVVLQAATGQLVQDSMVSAHSGKRLGPQCISNSLYNCVVLGADNRVGLLIGGVKYNHPNLNRCFACAFTGPHTQLVTGVHIYASSTNSFYSCQFERLTTAIKIQRKDADNCRYNGFYHPRFDHDNGTATYVVGQYDTGVGADIGENLHFIIEVSAGRSMLSQLYLNRYGAVPNLSVQSSHVDSGISLYRDLQFTERTLNIHSLPVRDVYIVPYRNLDISSEIGGTLSTNMPFQVADAFDDNAGNGTIYYSLDSDQLVYKDKSGNVKAFGFK